MKQISKQEAIMNAAGVMANIAGIITGEGLTRAHTSAPIMNLPELLNQLKAATREYNDLIIAELISRKQSSIINLDVIE